MRQDLHEGFTLHEVMQADFGVIRGKGIRGVYLCCMIPGAERTTWRTSCIFE